MRKDFGKVFLKTATVGMLALSLAVTPAATAFVSADEVSLFESYDEYGDVVTETEVNEDETYYFDEDDDEDETEKENVKILEQKNGEFTIDVSGSFKGLFNEVAEDYFFEEEYAIGEVMLRITPLDAKATGKFEIRDTSNTRDFEITGDKINVKGLVGGRYLVRVASLVNNHHNTPDTYIFSDWPGEIINVSGETSKFIPETALDNVTVESSGEPIKYNKSYMDDYNKKYSNRDKEYYRFPKMIASDESSVTLDFKDVIQDTIDTHKITEVYSVDLVVYGGGVDTTPKIKKSLDMSTVKISGLEKGINYYAYLYVLGSNGDYIDNFSCMNYVTISEDCLYKDNYNWECGDVILEQSGEKISSVESNLETDAGGSFERKYLNDDLISNTTNKELSIKSSGIIVGKFGSGNYNYCLNTGVSGYGGSKEYIIADKNGKIIEHSVSIDNIVWFKGTEAYYKVSICAVEDTNDGIERGNVISKLVAVFPGSANVKFDKKVKKADLSWTNIKGVKEYVVYFNKAKSGTKWVKYKTTKKNKMTIKGLGKGKLKKKSKDYEFGVQVIVDTPEGIKKSKIVMCH